MPSIEVTQDAYDWFQKVRKITLKDKRKFTLRENEAIILMLNMWEAGNMGKQVADSVSDLNKQFPQKTFEHYNAKFFRSS